MKRRALPPALRSPCRSCGHSKLFHGAQQGCTSIVLSKSPMSTAVIRKCTCQEWVAPVPKAKRTPAQKAILKSLGGHRESKGERLLRHQLEGCRIAFRQEVQAIPGRGYSFDFALDAPRILVEIQGGIWIGGGHSSGRGVSRDCEKGSLAAVHGWRLITATTEDVELGRAIGWIGRAMAYRAAPLGAPAEGKGSTESAGKAAIATLGDHP